MTALEDPPDCPELVSADIYLFLQLKSALKGRCFCDAINIIKDATEEQKKAFTKWLPGMFSTLPQSLAEVYICKSELFERKHILSDYTVLYFSEMK